MTRRESFASMLGRFGEHCRALRPRPGPAAGDSGPARHAARPRPYAASRPPQRHRCKPTGAAAGLALWALAAILVGCPASARASASDVGAGGRDSGSAGSRTLTQSGRRALSVAAAPGAADQTAQVPALPASPPPPPSYAGITAAWPPSLRQAVAAGAAAESASAGAAEAASASLSREVCGTGPRRG